MFCWRVHCSRGMRRATMEHCVPQRNRQLRRALSWTYEHVPERTKSDAIELRWKPRFQPVCGWHRAFKRRMAPSGRLASTHPETPLYCKKRRAKLARARAVAATVLTLVALSGRAQEQEHQHGDGEKLGTVHFATSCNEVAQKEFNRAVALLDSFQFSRAIEGFNAVLGEDATCGIAYWGIALSDWSNPFAAGMKDKRQMQAGLESVERGKTWAQRRSANERILRRWASCTAITGARLSERA